MAEQVLNKKAENNRKNMTSQKIQEIAIDAVFIALTYVFTAFVNIKLPIAANGGLIHLGNIPLFIAAIVFGWKAGMIAGGIGMGLFDMISGYWATWAPFTLVVVGLMGFAVGKITEKKNSYPRMILAMGTYFIWKLYCTGKIHSGKCCAGGSGCHNCTSDFSSVKKGSRTHF